MAGPLTGLDPSVIFLGEQSITEVSWYLVISKPGGELFDLLHSMIQEVGVKHVTQMITYGASAYVSANRLLEQKISAYFLESICCTLH